MVPSVLQVLEAVSTVEQACLQHVCWILDVHEHNARPAFDRAVADAFLEPCSVDEVLGEVIYGLTDRGRSVLDLPTR